MEICKSGIIESIKSQESTNGTKCKPNLLNVFPRIMGSPFNRRFVNNIVERDEYISEYRTYRPIFMTVYAFTKTMPSFQATHQYADVDKIAIDIDEGDVYSTMLDLHTYFSLLGAVHRIHLSGNGFHIYVWIKKNLKYPKLAIANYWDYLHGPSRCYKCGKELIINYCPLCHKSWDYRNPFTKETKESPKFNICSSTRGDLGRIIRYPNTKNFSAECYSITVDELCLKNLHSLKEFQEFAKKPYMPKSNIYFGDKLLDISEFDCSDEVYKTLDIIQLRLNPLSYSNMQSNDKYEFNIEECPYCIQQIIASDMKFRERNEFIKFMFNRTDTLLPPDGSDVMGVMYKISEYNDWIKWFFSNNHIDVLQRNIKIVQDNYALTSSCAKIKSMGYCNRDKCKWKDIINKN